MRAVGTTSGTRHDFCGSGSDAEGACKGDDGDDAGVSDGDDSRGSGSGLGVGEESADGFVIVRRSANCFFRPLWTTLTLVPCGLL